MTSPIQNWVMLSPGVEKRLRFSDHVLRKKTITDPVTKRPKEVESLEFIVSMEDGSPVSRTFSIVSQKLAGELGPYLIDRRYLRYEFVFIKDAPGTVAPRLVRATPV